MNLNNLTATVNKSAGKLVFWTKRNSPELLCISAIFTAAASIVLACKATTKVNEVLKESNERINDIHTCMKDEDLIDNGDYSKKQARKDLILIYSKTGLKLIKLYAPSIFSFSLSVAAIFGSHKIMKGRNLALAAAYSTIESGYRNYRERVKNKFGEEIEKEIFYDIHEETIKVKKKDENGNDIEIEETVKVPHYNHEDDCNVLLFDTANKNWEKSGRLNLDFLLMQEKFLNQKFRTYGYLFLYEVYDALGVDLSTIDIRKRQASHVLGWIYDPEDNTRDNYVSFGLHDELGNLNQKALDMSMYGERNVFLEFNTDGDILTGGNNEKKTFMKYVKC